MRNRTVTSDSLDENPWFADWCRTVERGFHGEKPSDEFVRRELATMHAVGATLRGAYVDAVPAHAVGVDRPVATFVDWTGSLDLGGALVDLHQISAVTVRATHRRRGLLRQLMTASLHRAHEHGVPVAGLTASEATIYGRFGFAPATRLQRAEVDTRGGLPMATRAVGTTEFVDPDELEAVAVEVFDAAHRRWTGSVHRDPTTMPTYLGLVDEKGSADPKLHAAAHWDDAGALDGYVTWTAWSDDKPAATIQDLVVTSWSAYLSLWHLLGSLDLIDTVTWRKGPLDDPLPWVLVDHRRYKVTSVHDHLWLRVLDPAAVLSARDYRVDAAVTLEVVDPLGLAGGRWLLETEGGRGHVTSTTAADVRIDVRGLSAAILGGVSVLTLARVGLVEGDTDGVADLDRLLRRAELPWSTTGF